MNRAVWWLAAASGGIFLICVLLGPKTTYTLIPYPQPGQRFPNDAELLWMATLHNPWLALLFGSLALSAVFTIWGILLHVARRAR